MFLIISTDSLTSLSQQAQASPRHAMYSNTAHRSAVVSTLVLDTPCANSISVMVGNLTWDRTEPRTLRWLSGVTGMSRRWHSLLLHARHARNTFNSLTDRLGNCAIFSSVLSAITHHTAVKKPSWMYALLYTTTDHLWNKSFQATSTGTDNKN